MSSFHQFLFARLEAGGFSTEDALASLLPLARQTAGAHAAGKVAPLEGVEALQVENGRIWFPEASLLDPRANRPRIQLLDRPPAAVEVLSEERRTFDVEGGTAKQANVLIGSREEELVRPVYLPGYLCWEHQLGHHDPLSDVFSLGLILGSLACGLDLNQPEDLEAFVSHRRNLFRLNPGLHPVLAKAIARMTELSRHRRPQDLATVIANLENYREQNVDFAFALASAEAATAPADRREAVLGKLQERLFEVSRRNRLLHFRSTLQAVNLTHASVPLSFDVRSIRPDQVLTWSGAFAKAVSAGEPVSLNGYLNFAEQLYLPGLLDRIRSQAVRDSAEFGFEQLRLAICFLRWANIKETPPEHYDSPLVLLPVRLAKKKGVRDTYLLQPLTTEAEINPVVRHLFRQLYGIDLPAAIDLSETTLDQFFEDLSSRITASEPGITLNKVDRPRIDLIHDQAKRRLDRYRRSARISGKNVHTFLDLDYSYDRANYHPLGLAVFRSRIRPSPTHLREIVQERPAPRSFFWEASGAEASGGEGSSAVKEKQFYAIREEADGNPYVWDFDLCRLTLGNFRYRKMTLVRDYAELLEGRPANPAFDAVFSPAPRPLDLEPPAPPALEERYPIVDCDPTQATAIGLAAGGASYLIQGPPGTGKSQTITNLIADFVRRGKRVLFVCEKRAAIDVVFARLHQQGLDRLCCLIHDSQTDKKDFILDLKATYEGMLEGEENGGQVWQRRRLNLLEAFRRELEPLEEFNRAMLAEPPQAGTSVLRLLERAIELESARPELTPAQEEALPDYAQWAANAEVLERLIEAINRVEPGGVLAHHPLRLLASELAGQQRPGQVIETNLRAALRHLEELSEALCGACGAIGGRATVRQAGWVLDYAAAVEPLARSGLLSLLDERSARAGVFARLQEHYRAGRAALDAAREADRNWTDKLPRGEVAIALEQARALEGRFLSILKPAWWRLKRVLGTRYRFDAHAVRPSPSQVLTWLEAEYQAGAALEELDRAARRELGIEVSLESVAGQVGQARALLSKSDPGLAAFQQFLLESDRGQEIVATLVGVRPVWAALRQACAAILEDYGDQPLEELGADLRAIDGSLDRLGDFLECLRELARLPAELAAAFRRLPVDARALEAAMADKAVRELFRTDAVLHRFTGAIREAHVERLSRLWRKWQEVNAAVVVERVRRNFLDHVRRSSLPAAQLTEEEKEFKAAYQRGRRELEHEFGKVMRYRSIRDLAAGDPGLVLRDLKPVWLMSPLSVSDTLPLRSDAFDAVIFDEASQITLEEAVPTLFRAPQAIVVGDEMQLPPTDFFSAKAEGGEEEGLLVSEGGQVFEYDLSANSFLNHAAKNMPSRMLGWHYRSRSESLIAYSNWAFYQGRLLTVPDGRLAVEDRREILVASPQEGEVNVAKLLGRPLSFHLLRGAVYENRRNRAEARYIAQLVRGLLAGNSGYSVGIVAFSEAQQEEIESALRALASQDRKFAERLEEEEEREVDGQFVGLLVKNLENIQGDERDVMILSICYGPGPDGRMRMNFGPINQTGGEKRLNVAFSRAKHRMAVVSSIRHEDITNDYNDGANCLKTYLQYAAACSAGDAAASRRVLAQLAVLREESERGGQSGVPVVARQIADSLVERGYAVELGVGMSHFRCDVAARRHGDLEHRLGVLVDGEDHYREPDLLDREMMRPRLLQSFGWRIARVLARDWRQDRRAVLERLVELIEKGAGASPPAASGGEEEGGDPWAEFDGEILIPADPPARPPEAPPPAPAAPTGGKRHFELVEGRSAKFWEVAVTGNTIAVRYGRLGATGKTQIKIFADVHLAQQSADRLISEKLRKGYREK